LYVDGNLVYNWEGGVVHPYVTAGVGLYHYRFDIPRAETTDNKFGADLGGGLEYFLNRRVTLTGELLYHAVSSPVHGLVDFEPRFWSFGVGLKRYF
jgi:opacity protein-like surface antigen